MKKIFLFILLMLAAPFPALSQKLSLQEASSIMESIDQGAYRFRQTTQDGATDTGLMYIKRPGRIRFEYESQADTMMIAGGGQLAIFDPRSGSPERYPLQTTPLKVILDRNINLASSNMVVGHGYDGTNTLIVARDPARPDQGQITLLFARNPARLVGWDLEDDSGYKTRIRLSSFSRGQLSDRLFSIRREMANWPH